MNRLFVLSCLISLALPPARAKAEIAFGESVEWIAADSDRIVIGKVVNAERATGQDMIVYDIATISITQTLKGEKAASATFLVRSFLSGVAKHWMKDDVELLFFLVKRERSTETEKLPKNCDWIVRDDHNHACAIYLAKIDRPSAYSFPTYTREFEILTEPRDIVKQVENFIASLPKDWSAKSHKVETPWNSTVQKKLYSGSTSFLTVPVDEQLEKIGRTWSKSDSSKQRLEGAKILRYFKNDINIEILKSLLDDPNFSDATMHKSVPGQAAMALVWHKKLYHVRQAAYDALREFHIEVTAPILEEPLEGEDK